MSIRRNPFLDGTDGLHFASKIILRLVKMNTLTPILYTFPKNKDWQIYKLIRKDKFYKKDIYF